MDPKSFFDSESQTELEAAITEAELKTSGEIRIHIESICQDPFERGKEVFAELKMHETEEKNGVLFYLAVESQRFAILGDEGINKKVPEDFWEKIKEDMGTHFKQGQFVRGLKNGVLAAGEQLGAYFVRKEDDVDELSNTISFGE